MGDVLKCKICGGKFVKDATMLSCMGFDFREKICPECKRAKAFSGNGNEGCGKGGSFLGGVVGGIAGASAAKKAAKEAEEEARTAERKERHRAAIAAIKNFQFDESDEENFNRSAIIFLDEYNTCNAGLMADNEYKKVYKQRIESEIKILKTNNPVFAEKLQNLYTDAKAEMKAKLKTKLIISGVIFGITTIGGLVLGITDVIDGMNAGYGLLAGVMGGLVFSSLPQMGSSDNRREDNE